MAWQFFKMLQNIQVSRTLIQDSCFVKYFLKLLFFYRLSGFFSADLTDREIRLVWPSGRLLFGLCQYIFMSIGWTWSHTYYMSRKVSFPVKIDEMVYVVYAHLKFASYFIISSGIFLKSTSIFDLLTLWASVETSILKPGQQPYFKRAFSWLRLFLAVYIVHILVFLVVVIIRGNDFFKMTQLIIHGAIPLYTRLWLCLSQHFAILFFVLSTVSVVYIIMSFKHILRSFNDNLSDLLASEQVNMYDLSSRRFQYMEMSRLLKMINRDFGHLFLVSFIHIVITMLCACYITIQYNNVISNNIMLSSVAYLGLMLIYMCDAGQSIKAEVSAILDS